MKEAILKLKGSVKQFAASGREIGQRIRQSKGLDRFNLWNEKRWLGDDARSCLLAYACLRGRPYIQVERKVRQGNEPSATAIYDNLVAVLDDTQRLAWTKERVRDWLEGKPSVVQEPTPGVAA